MTDYDPTDLAPVTDADYCARCSDELGPHPALLGGRVLHLDCAVLEMVETHGDGTACNATRSELRAAAALVAEYAEALVRRAEAAPEEKAAREFAKLQPITTAVRMPGGAQ